MTLALLSLTHPGRSLTCGRVNVDVRTFNIPHLCSGITWQYIQVSIIKTHCWYDLSTHLVTIGRSAATFHPRHFYVRLPLRSRFVQCPSHRKSRAKCSQKKHDYRQTEGSELDLNTRSNVHCRHLSIYLAITSSKVCH